MRDKLAPLMNMMGGSSNNENEMDKLFTKVEELRNRTQALKKMLNDAEKTTFVAVCIPEFLSVYETERLVQDLTGFDIDIFNIVVNQIVFPEESGSCRKCVARYSMQKKYLEQIGQLYEDFHVVLMPLEDEEIRGIDRLQVYSKKLLVEKKLPSVGST